ncbi:MAG TPA: S8 family peptidase [Aestuariivirgaceae bacterium]|nr:S8 family peptidase [Aestuariivirgaceae bacterium]
MAKQIRRLVRRRTTASKSTPANRVAPGDNDDPGNNPLPEQTLRRLIFRTFGHQRFTQDSPILPDVWLGYAKADEDVALDLILTPRAGHVPGTVSTLIEKRLARHHGRVSRSANSAPAAHEERALIAYNRSCVVAKLTFKELMLVVIPMTSWWLGLPKAYRSFEEVGRRLGAFKDDRIAFKKIVNTSDKWEYFRFIVLAGFVAGWRKLTAPEDTAETLQSDTNNFADVRQVAITFLDLLRRFKPIPDHDERAEVWKISLNRPTQIALFESRAAIKGDAAQNLFNISTKDLAWAVVDCGIDATHPAFLDRDAPKKKIAAPARSRIVKTFDFTFLRMLLALQKNTYRTAGDRVINLNPQQQDEMKDFRRRVRLGREIDWEMILPLIEIPHDQRYEPPTHEHGTHVAGILAGNWLAEDNEEGQTLVGICPELRMYDFRVFDNLGNTEEFIIMAALQVVGHLNRFRENPVIHGVNMSLSMQHEVISYACGRTPICDECTALFGDGVVVVAAAGNQGYNESEETGGGQFGSYRMASITDPGNADCVITVGSTHRSEPHTYGVSYFSGRGPTGDGRRKPDLVAPGEKITAPIPNRGSKRMDGTSMAAPHVSGAAALLMARNRELIGHPGRIKQILCKSATDLGREVNFQGAGMLDILRALQSV